MRHQLKAGLIVVALLAAGSALGSQRTFVSTDGVNNPLCSLVAPCRDFGAAIIPTNAGGEIIVLNSGGYGAVAISKSVTITAPAGIYAGISVLAGDGVSVTGSAIKVVLRGLSINGQGGTNGINFAASSSTLIVERCQISGMSGRGILVDASGVAARVVINDTTVDGSGNNGIEVTNAKAEIVDSRLINGLATGVVSGFGGHVAVSRTVMSHNSDCGARALAQSPGSGSAELFVADSTATNNGGCGIIGYASGSGTLAVLSVARSQVSANFDFSNGTGIQVLALANGQATANIIDDDIQANGSSGLIAYAATGGTTLMRASGNSVSRQTFGISNTGATFESLGTNTVRGNGTDKTGTITVVPGD